MCLKEVNQQLVEIIDKRLGGHSGRAAVHAVYQGYEDYLLAKRTGNRLLSRRDTSESPLPFQRYGCRWARMMKQRLNPKGLWRQHRANAARASQARSICARLSERAGTARHAFLPLKGLHALVDEAARLLSICVMKEIRREAFQGFDGGFSDEASGLSSGCTIMCTAVDGYMRINPNGLYDRRKAYDAGLTTAFRHDAACAVFQPDGHEETQDQLFDCCRAFLLVHLAEIMEGSQGRDRIGRDTRYGVIARCLNSMGENLPVFSSIDCLRAADDASER